MIVDAHSHLGWSKIFNAGVTEEILLGTMDAHGIQASVVMPAAGSDPTPTHDAIARLAEQHPGRIFGMISMTPLMGEEAYTREFRRCREQHGFVAVKIHPVAHAVAPNLPVCDVVFELARAAGIPVMVHTGLGSPFALPSLLIPRARQYPDLPIILAHAGFAIYTAEAIIVAQECPNVYLEPSWCTAGDIKRMVTTFGARRVLYGGDLPFNVPVELSKYRTVGLSEEDYRMCVGGSAIALFRLPIRQKPAP
ncbi:MAG: amidohydrolase family protein [Armatimonadota bacterium]|nr:amidohydrolase family protein [Armatimonadota bacterium]